MSNQPSFLAKCVAVFIDLTIGAFIVSCSIKIILPALFSVESIPYPNLHIISIVIGALAVVLLGKWYSASIGLLFVQGKQHSPSHNNVLNNLGWLTFTIAVLAGWIVTDISPIEFLSGEGLRGAGRIFGSLITPEFSILGEALRAMVETVFTAFMATIVAVPISFVLSFPAARNIMSNTKNQKAVYSLLRIVLNVSRSMEPIIWAIIFSVWVGIGPFAGMLALVVHTIASLTKQYSEQIEDVDQGPLEAIEATGANKLHVLWFAVVPQCVIPFLSFTIYRWDINVRMATIIGFVGGGGIGTLLTQYQGLSKFHEVGTLMIIITAVVWLLDVVSAKIREALK